MTPEQEQIIRNAVMALPEYPDQGPGVADIMVISYPADDMRVILHFGVRREDLIGQLLGLTAVDLRGRPLDSHSTSPGDVANMVVEQLENLSDA